MSSARVKDAGFLQQHIEKLLLGGGVLILIIAFFLFVIRNPFGLEVNGRAFTSTEEAIGDLQRGDSRLESGLENSEPLPKIEIPQFDEEIGGLIGGDRNRVKQPARIAAPGLTLLSIDPPKSAPPRYATVYPHMPKDVRHTHGTDVLDVDFNRQGEAFAKLWGEERNPADFSMFIASADFDVWKWAQRLQDTTAGEGETKIPAGIWSQRFGIAGVALLREELDEDSGVWVNRKIVEALPGQYRMMPSDTAPDEPVEAITVLTQIRENQEIIAKPQLPWVTGFVQVVPPGGDELLDDPEAGGIGLNIGAEALGSAETRIKQLEEKIEQLQERNRIRDERRRPADTVPSGLGDAPGTTDSLGRTERADPLGRQIERLNRQISQLQPRATREREERERKQRLRKEQEEIRRQRANQLGTGNRFGLGVQPGEEGDELRDLGVQEGATVRVWAADPTMQPGKTYQYKLLVSVINPLYAVPRLEETQLAENKSKLSLLPQAEEIESQPWIGPITVEPKYRFFFTSGNEDRAKVEVFRRIEGIQQKQAFDLTPGDMIGRIVEIQAEDELEEDRTIDMRVGAVIIDIETRRNPLGGTSAHMICMNLETGQLFERSQAVDSKAPDRRTLVKEIEDGPQWPLRPEVGEERFEEGEFGAPPGFDEFR